MGESLRAIVKEAKLTPVQKRAFKKLIKDGGWLTPFDLQESLSTLRALEKKKLVKSRGWEAFGAMFDPRTTIEFISRYQVGKK